MDEEIDAVPVWFSVKAGSVANVLLHCALMKMTETWQINSSYLQSYLPLVKMTSQSIKLSRELSADREDKDP